MPFDAYRSKRFVFEIDIVHQFDFAIISERSVVYVFGEISEILRRVNRKHVRRDVFRRGICLNCFYFEINAARRIPILVACRFGKFNRYRNRYYIRTDFDYFVSRYFRGAVILRAVYIKCKPLEKPRIVDTTDNRTIFNGYVAFIFDNRRGGVF